MALRVIGDRLTGINVNGSGNFQFTLQMPDGFPGVVALSLWAANTNPAVTFSLEPNSGSGGPAWDGSYEYVITGVASVVSTTIDLHVHLTLSDEPVEHGTYGGVVIQ